MVAPEYDITTAALARLSDLVVRDTPSSPFVGYYQVTRCVDAWRAFATWMERSASPSSRAWVRAEYPSGLDDEEYNATEIRTRFLRFESDIRSGGSGDSWLGEMAAMASEILLRYVLHAERHLTPTAGRSELVREWAEVRGRAEELHGSIALAKALEEVTKATSESVRAAHAAREATSGLGLRRLAESHDSFAKSEGKAWMGFVGAAVALTVAVFVFAVASPPPADASVPAVVSHVALLAIGLGLAGFLATQGSRKQANQTWSDALSVQLRTFNDYVVSIESPEVRDQVRLMFASRAFGSAPDKADGSGSDAISWVPQLVNAALESKK